MESNDDRARSGSGGTGQGGARGYGDTGDMSGSAAYGTRGGGSTGSSPGGGTSGEERVADRAKEAMSGAQEKLADVGSNVRERAGSARNSFADLLESGANKLRQRAAAGGTRYAAAAGDGGPPVQAETGGMERMNTRVAGKMQTTADWVREADLDSLRTGVERQVREHPGRTLLIALGLGYVIGKAFRR